MRNRNRKLRGQQLVHMALSSCLMFWPLYDPTDWSWRLNVLVPAVLATRLVFKATLVRDPDDEDVMVMSRTSSPSGLLFGPLQLTILMVWLGLTKFKSEEAAILLAAAGIGDGVAPLIGNRYGRHVYRMPFSNNKTMEGSVCGVFLGTIAGYYLYSYFLGMMEEWRPLRIVLAFGGIAAVVEGTSPGNMDNILVPVIMHFSMERIDEWLVEEDTGG